MPSPPCRKLPPLRTWPHWPAWPPAAPPPQRHHSHRATAPSSGPPQTRGRDMSRPRPGTAAAEVPRVGVGHARHLEQPTAVVPLRIAQVVRVLEPGEPSLVPRQPRAPGGGVREVRSSLQHSRHKSRLYLHQRERDDRVRDAEESERRVVHVEQVLEERSHAPATDGERQPTLPGRVAIFAPEAVHTRSRTGGVKRHGGVAQEREVVLIPDTVYHHVHIGLHVAVLEPDPAVRQQLGHRRRAQQTVVCGRRLRRMASAVGGQRAAATRLADLARHIGAARARADAQDRLRDEWLGRVVLARMHDAVGKGGSTGEVGVGRQVVVAVCDNDRVELFVHVASTSTYLPDAALVRRPAHHSAYRLHGAVQADATTEVVLPRVRLEIRADGSRRDE
eukprot:scaffold4827_cov109-Isochrysis_galbana.AAC.2